MRSQNLTEAGWDEPFDPDIEIDVQFQGKPHRLPVRAATWWDTPAECGVSFWIDMPGVPGYDYHYHVPLPGASYNAEKFSVRDLDQSDVYDMADGQAAADKIEAGNPYRLVKRQDRWTLVPQGGSTVPVPESLAERLLNG